jgi:DNA-binding FadR family transcriptional regulator
MIGSVSNGDRGSHALALLRAFISDRHLEMNARLPPERALAAELGISRATLRKALATLESQGRVWRHIGKGTFVGSRPIEGDGGLSPLVGRTSPADVVEARLSIEPELARLAALNASADDIHSLRHCCRKSRSAEDWRVYEIWDDRVHRAVAEATHNALLLSLFDTLNTVRRAVVWNRARGTRRPPRDHHSFSEHDALVDAIEGRDAERAALCMRAHLGSVGRHLSDLAPAPTRTAAQPA